MSRPHRRINDGKPKVIHSMNKRTPSSKLYIGDSNSRNAVFEKEKIKSANILGRGIVFDESTKPKSLRIIDDRLNLLSEYKELKDLISELPIDAIDITKTKQAPSQVIQDLSKLTDLGDIIRAGKIEDDIYGEVLEHHLTEFEDGLTNQLIQPGPTVVTLHYIRTIIAPLPTTSSLLVEMLETYHKTKAITTEDRLRMLNTRDICNQLGIAEILTDEIGDEIRQLTDENRAQYYDALATNIATGTVTVTTVGDLEGQITAERLQFEQTDKTKENTKKYTQSTSDLEYQNKLADIIETKREINKLKTGGLPPSANEFDNLSVWIASERGHLEDLIDELVSQYPDVANNTTRDQLPEKSLNWWKNKLKEPIKKEEERKIEEDQLIFRPGYSEDTPSHITTPQIKDREYDKRTRVKTNIYGERPKQMGSIIDTLTKNLYKKKEISLELTKSKIEIHKKLQKEQNKLNKEKQAEIKALGTVDTDAFWELLESLTKPEPEPKSITTDIKTHDLSEDFPELFTHQDPTIEAGLNEIVTIQDAKDLVIALQFKDLMGKNKITPEDYEAADAEVAADDQRTLAVELIKTEGELILTRETIRAIEVKESIRDISPTQWSSEDSEAIANISRQRKRHLRNIEQERIRKKLDVMPFRLKPEFDIAKFIRERDKRLRKKLLEKVKERQKTESASSQTKKKIIKPKPSPKKKPLSKPSPKKKPLSKPSPKKKPLSKPSPKKKPLSKPDSPKPSKKQPEQEKKVLYQ